VLSQAESELDSLLAEREREREGERDLFILCLKSKPKQRKKEEEQRVNEGGCTFFYRSFERLKQL